SENRIGDHQHAHILRQLPGQYRTLDVAPGQGADRAFRVRRAHVETTDQLPRLLANRSAVDQPAITAERRPVEIAQGQVLRHAHAGDTGIAEGLLGQAEELAALHLLPTGRIGLAIDTDFPAGHLALAQQRLGQLALTVAGDPGDTDDLPRQHAE